MINVLLSVAVGFAVAVLVKLLGFSLLAGIIPGTIAALGAMVVLGRRSFMQLQAVSQAVQAELSSMTANQKEQKVKVDKAIKLLEGALPLGKWQFLVESQLYGQIGMLKYMFKDHDGALAAFAKSSPRDYLARAMQGALLFQRKDFAGMQRCFEDAVKHGKKESLMWAAYAWCLLQNKDSERAMQVLARGVSENPSDEKLKKALTDLQNDKKLKMKAWEPMWWQLGLETPPMQQVQFMGGGRRSRFMRR